MVSTMTGMALDEFTRLYDAEGPFELVNGVREALSPTNFGHATIANFLTRVLSNFALAKQLGSAFTETPFVISMSDDATWVKGSRVPDVMFIQAKRLAAYKQANPNWNMRPLASVPDLVAEIVSPNDRYSHINDKVANYLADGVQLAWVIDPQRRTVAVHQAGSNQFMVLSVEQMLTAGSVIDGFEMNVAELFQ